MSEVVAGGDGVSLEAEAAAFSAERFGKGHTVEHALEGLRRKDPDSYELRDGHVLLQAHRAERLDQPKEREGPSAKDLKELDDTLEELESGRAEHLPYETTRELRAFFRRGKKKWSNLIGPQIMFTGSLAPEVLKNYKIYEAILKEIDHQLPTAEAAYPLQPYQFPDIKTLADLLPQGTGMPTIEQAAAVFDVIEKDITKKKTDAEGDPRFRAQQQAVRELYDKHEDELNDDEAKAAFSVIVTPGDDDAQADIKISKYDDATPKPELEEGSYYFIYDGIEDIPYAEGIGELNGINGLDTNITQTVAGIKNLQKEPPPPVITKAQEFNIRVLLQRLGKQFAYGMIDDRYQLPFGQLTNMLIIKLDQAQLIPEPVAA